MTENVSSDTLRDDLPDHACPKMGDGIHGLLRGAGYSVCGHCEEEL